jgi:dTDP-glucose pyrophosphorylase
MIKDEKRYIFVINGEDKDMFHLDSVLRLLTDNKCEVVVLNGETKGACCSSLMAIDYINNDDELIICNGDQLIFEDLNKPLDLFRTKDADAGILSFEAVHPRWAFARIENEKVIEAAEKRPISKNAIAGFYYYKNGSEYVQAAMKSIEKDANVNGIFYVAPVLNELVLDYKNIFVYHIDVKDYYTFNVPEKVKQFNRSDYE